MTIEFEIIQRLTTLEAEGRHMLQEMDRMRLNCEREVEALKEDQDRALAEMKAKYDAELGKYARVFGNATKAGFVFIGFLGAGLVLAIGADKAVQKIVAWRQLWGG